MRALYLLRHAKAVADDPGGDRARPLAERGERASRTIAGWMARQGIAPGLALCSTAVRTRQTLTLLLPSLRLPPEILYEEELYLAPARGLLARLRRLTADIDTVLLVGHNPGLHELAVALADPAGGGQVKRLAAGFPTAALAAFEVPESWPKLVRRSAQLVAFVTPKEIGGERD